MRRPGPPLCSRSQRVAWWLQRELAELARPETIVPVVASDLATELASGLVVTTAALSAVANARVETWATRSWVHQQGSRTQKNAEQAWPCAA